MPASRRWATVNVAARLQGLTKTLGCVAVVSEAVYQAARVAPAQIRDVAVDGRSRPSGSTPRKR